MALHNKCGTCKECKHWEYINVKEYPGGSYEWGYCHKFIGRDPQDEESWEDLSVYFTRAEQEYCSSFKEKEDDK
jgi:hypothetical protein